MLLDLDCGNSRVKWRIAASGEVKNRGACASGADEWLPVAKRLCVERIRVSTVAGAVERERIEKKCRAELDIEPQFARSESFACGIHNGYERPERLGVDRWLAVIAGYRLSGGKPCCVVDCGSAITVDYVTADGFHQGGVIAPGLRLMRNALLNDTREVNVRRHENQGQTDSSTAPAPLGLNTETAVDLGLKFMEAGLIEIALARYELLFKEQAMLILTGGDAPEIRTLVNHDALLAPDLVLDGLNLVLP